MRTQLPRSLTTPRRRRPRHAARALSAALFRLHPRLEAMEDRTLLTTFLVTTTADDGPGSLRQAILDSNVATGQANTIDFAIPGDGVQTIDPLSPLPAITQAVLMDGWSEPGTAGNPLIEVSGQNAGAADGLTIVGSQVTIRGLIVNGFSQGAGIRITGSDAEGDWIYGCFLGTDPTGTQAASNNEGVELDAGAANDLVGSDGDGVGDAAERNLLSGNLFAGVLITGQGTTGNAVAGNLIGTDLSGAVALANGAQTLYVPIGNFIGGGVVIADGATSNRIGTHGKSLDDVGERNVIAGNENDGVDIYGDGTRDNIVAGNFIGTDLTGSHPLGNTGDGVFLAVGASSNWMGINPLGGTAVEDEANVISGNGDYGVHIQSGGHENTVAGNKIGTDLSGTIALPNSVGGVDIEQGSSNNTIGGTTADAGNLITGNDRLGVRVADTSVGNQITANRIFANSGQAIDLGGDGVTPNYPAPRQGSNNFQNFPALAATPGGQYEGWLAGSTPNTTFRVDVFASAVYGPGGAGEAEDFLGSLEVKTDSHGQARFTVPYAPPAGLPIITATATDSLGNTSELSAIRSATLEVPPTSLRVTPNQALTFSTASGEGIAVQDPDVGPLDPTWSLTLSVTAGTLRLSSTTGLAGSGDGTGSLSYTGSLSRLNAALQGLTYTPPAGPHVLATLTLTVSSPGATPQEARLPLSDRVFVVTTTNDSGPGSLRQAILDSNTATGATNSIVFAIPGAGVQTIAPSSPLPPVTTPTVLDGTSQPGFSGTPRVILSGVPEALVVSSDVTIKSLAMRSCQLLVTTDEQLVAQVHADGAAARLSLRDSDGRILMQSDGQSVADPNGLIAIHVPKGSYALQADELGGTGNYTLTATMLPASAPFRPLPVGNRPASIVAADFNGDGQTDLAVSNYYGDNPNNYLGPGSVSVLLGNGDGTFRPQVTYAVGHVPLSMVTGDFNGDGKPDLADVNQDDGTVSVLPGRGDGTFGPVETFSLGVADGWGLYAMTAGDFNDDGRTDLAVAMNIYYFNTGVSTNKFVVYLSDPERVWDPPIEYALGQAPASIMTGDFNGDGHADLAIAGSSYDTTAGASVGQLTVFPGRGDGTFQHPFVSTLGQSPSSIVAGDFNGDGHTDLAVSDSTWGIPDYVSVLMGRGDGTFLSPVQYGTGQVPSTVVTGDFNGDGRLDVAVSDGSNDVSVLIGEGDGTFQTEVRYAPAGSGLNSLAAGDFDHNGRSDLATVDLYSHDVMILLSNPGGTFQDRVTNDVGGFPYSTAAGDFNGDGRLDLAVIDFPSDVNILLGNGDGTFQQGVRYPSGLYPNDLITADFNGDGRLDLALASTASNTVSVLLGDGDGTFQPAVQYPAGQAPFALVAGDFNGDGYPDLAAVDLGDSYAGGSMLAVLLGHGDGGFRPATLTALPGPTTNSIVAGDFDDDGRLDLAVAGSDSHGDDLVSILKGRGDGTFELRRTYSLGGAAGSTTSALVAGDFNGDGRLDLATTSTATLGFGGPSDISVLMGEGDGTFDSILIGEASAMGLVASDFNGDGHPDLAIANGNGYSNPAEYQGSVSILLGDSKGTFQPGGQYGVGTSPLSAVAGDFNGDGRMDLVTANQGTNDLSVYLGNGDGTFVDAGQLVTTPHSTPLLADVNGDGAEDLLVVDGSGNILYRQGHVGTSDFDPPVTVNPNRPSRDIAWVPGGNQVPVLASVDARDDAVSLYAWRDGAFVRLGSLAAGRLPAQIIAADLDRYGRTDLVVRNAGDGTLSVFYGDQLAGPVIQHDLSPSFRPAVILPIGMGVSDVQAIDTTGRGVFDLVITYKLAGQVGILRNLGGGAFAPPAPYRAGTGLSAIDDSSGSPRVTSLEGTTGVAPVRSTTGGPADLVTINTGSDALGLLAGLGGGRFANPIAIPTPRPAQVVRVADFNGDGLADLAVLTANEVSLYLGDPKGGFASPVVYDAGLAPTGLTVDDVDHDGRPDLLVGNSYGDVLVLLGQGDGTFRPYRKADQAVALAVADLTGDGKPDFIYADQGLDRVVVQYGGDTTKVLGNQATGLLSPGAVKLADLTGDGIPDLIVANSGSNNVLVYPGTGDGQFGPALNGGHGFFAGTNPTGIAVANLNGQPDLIVANSGSNDVSILLGQGKGSSFTLIPGPRIRTDAGPVAVAAGDILGTGKTDLAVANRQANDVQVFPGIGGGFFGQTPTTYAVGQAPSGLFLGNFDGSGTGIATLNAGSDTISLIGRGGVVQTIATGGLRPSSGFAGEFTGNSFTDLVVGNAGDGRFSLFTGGPGGLSLSQVTTSAAVPSPTALSFAGVSDGVLSFYAASAGREAASLLAFDIGVPAGPAGELAGEGLAAGTGQSVGSVLAAATVGAFQQAAQLLGLRGSALDLIAPLLTVSVIPGEPGGAQSEGEIALLASFLPSTGAAVAQRLAPPHPEGSSGGEAAEGDRGKPGGDEAAEAGLPPWAQFAVGLERAWEGLRIDMLRRLGVDPGAADRAEPAPGRESPAPVAAPAPAAPDRQGQVQPLPGGFGKELAPVEERTPQDSPPTHRTAVDVIGAAIAELADGPFARSRHGNRSSDRTREVLIVGDRLALPVAAAVILASTEGLARWIGPGRFRRQGRARTRFGRLMFAS